MKNARLLVLVTAMALWPGAAHAMNWWVWLEELSGPGPFTGATFLAPLICFEDGEQVSCGRATRERGQTLVARTGRFTSGNRPRFQDLPRDDEDNRGAVYVVPISGLYLFRVHRSVDVGLGAGLMRFSGDRFDAFYRFTLTPAHASLRPLLLWKTNRWTRLLRIEVDSTFVTKGFRGTDFGNTRTTFRSEPEFLTSAGVIIDVGAFFFATP
jgi:hypothetical protein